MPESPVFALDDGEQRELLERFLRYIAIDTRSSESSETFPSTEGQWDLLRLLEGELKALGLREVELDAHGYLLATLPANLPPGQEAPTVGFLAHVDTYPCTPGKCENPQVIEGYDGGDIPLRGVPGRVLKASENPLLLQCAGDTVVTTDGTTLLGADDKAGVAEIMTGLAWLLRHPEVPHGKIRVAFTPDEETGKGMRFFDVKKFGAEVAYTFDGSVLGEIEVETFHADSAQVIVRGEDTHPGTAKGRMVNALRASAYLMGRLPEGHLPETTEGRESFLHPYAIQGEVGAVTIQTLVRAFTREELRQREEDLLRAARETEAAFPGCSVEVRFEESYRNMKEVLDRHPAVVERAVEAVRLAGLQPVLGAIRGGTDGAHLCFQGLPTPNVFAGGVNFHGVTEWVSLRWMAKAVETFLHLARLWGRSA
ncbi:MAG: peptidase T [Acidobacteriota bacterium]